MNHNTMHSNHTLKTLMLSSLGGALEVFDFVIFIFLNDIIQQLFFPQSMPYWLKISQTFLIFSAGYLARPIGGILMARYADRLGRKKVFTTTVLMMSLPCFFISLMPTYHHIGYFAPLLLLVFRLIQGAAVGGEVPSAWVFVYEHTPRQQSGIVLGALQAGLTVGYLLGAVVGVVLFSVFTSEDILSYAWRIPFFIGGVCGVISIFMRRQLQETPVFLEMHKTKSKEVPLSLLQLLKRHRQQIAPAIITSCVLTSAVVVLVVITPTLLRQYYGLTAQESFIFSSIAIMALNVGCVLAGWVADKKGEWRAFYYYCIALLIGFVTFYVLIEFSFAWKIVAGIIAGLCCGVVGIVPSIMVRLFPVQSRVTGISVTYNIAYSIWAGISPPLLIGLMFISTFFPLLYIVAMSLLGVVLYKIMQQIKMVSE